jgi:hypothetical protein
VLLAGCERPAWFEVFGDNELDRAVLSVWGTGPTDVYAVGGPVGNGQPTLALRFHRGAWRELNPGGTGTLWWVAGSGATDVWMVGTGGRILHWDGESFAEHASGTTATLWGVWAASPDDAWAVGGTPNGGTAAAADNDLVLHWDGAAWTRVALPRRLGVALFKVWGSASDNVYAVGEGGVIWHRTAEGWRLESEPPLATWPLLTVAGCGPDEVYAVGGRDVLRWDGARWAKEEVALTGSVNGVACGAGETLLVGSGGLKLRKSGGAWTSESSKPPFTDLHAAWADGTGAFWAGGGDFVSPPIAGRAREGVVARYGLGTVTDARGE